MVKDQIVTMRKSGMTFGDIAKGLNERGQKTPSGLTWTATRVSNAFQNATGRKSKTANAAKTAHKRTKTIEAADFVMGLVRQVHSSSQATTTKQAVINGLVNAYTTLN